MDMEVGIFRTTGRAARPIVATTLRELETVDLLALGEEKGSEAPAIKRLSDRHHALARNLASGMGESEAAIMCGYAASRVSILKDDPAFKELLAFYRNDVSAQYRDLHQRLSGLAMDAAEELSDRLEAAPEDISVGQLMEITKMGADRTGYGPQTSSTNVNINVDLASRLQKARERVEERKRLEG